MMVRTLALLSLIACSSAGFAQSVDRPLGLQPGDEYRLIFVSEGTRNALTTNIADYNAFVGQEADRAGSLVGNLDADWFALASAGGTSAIANTGTDPSPAGPTGTPIYLIDGETRFADDYDTLWEGGSSGGFYVSGNMLDQFGVLPDSGVNDVWTGTDFFGLGGGFGGPLGRTPRPTIGASVASNSRWINNNFTQTTADNSLSLYAISSVLVVVPEPTSIVLTLALAVAYTFRRSTAAQ